MAAKLSNIDDVRRALIESQGSPVEVEDDQTHAVYVIVARDEFQKKYQPMYDGSEADLSELHQLADESFSGPDGWDAPGMELYDNYDEHQQQA